MSGYGSYRAFTQILLYFSTQDILKLSKKDKPLLKKIEHQLGKIIREPALSKSLRNVLRNTWRVHINPFVLVYEIVGDEVWVLDFDYHDKIYKKH
jgi:mRNA-degrading endonuclease RelE of RelBE toxin-antitoxin system